MTRRIEVARRRDRKCERGQALLLITLSIVALCGVLGLVVDLGYGYYVRQCAKAAAEAAAMAAAEAALQSVSSGSQIRCGSNSTLCNTSPVACSNPPTSPPTNN